MNPNHSWLLENVVYNDPSVLKTITGKFLPQNANRQFLDISILTQNEIVVFSEFLPSINEELTSVNFKFEESCVDFWSYSLQESQFDLILVLDCSQNLHLLSLKNLPIPHSSHNCILNTYKIPNSISRFPTNKNTTNNQQIKEENEPNIFKSQFLIKNEFSISLFKNKKIPKIELIKPYIKNSSNFSNPNPIILEKLIPKYFITMDENTGYIIVCANSYSFLIIPSLTLNKDGITEQIELKIQTENLFHFDSFRYELESISFIKTCKKHQKCQAIVLCLFNDLKNHLICGKTFFFDWNNLIKNHINPKDNYHKPISETHFIPYFNYIPTSLLSKIYNMRILCTHIPVIHMHSTHVSVGKSENTISVPVYASTCGYKYFSCSECIFKFRKLLVIFNNETNELKFINYDLLTENINHESLTINLRDYYQDRIYIDLRDLVIIEENVDEQRIKLLISSKCMEMFTLTLQFKDNSVIEFNLTKLQINSPGFELSDISSISPYIFLNEELQIVKSILVSSTFGVIKKITFPNFNQEFIISPKVIEILKLERAISIPNPIENRIILAAKRYQCFWDQIKGGYNFHFDFILRYIFLNTSKISTITQFSTLKKGVIGIHFILLEENKYMVIYSKFLETQIDLLVKQESISETKYDLKNIQINGFLLNGYTTILCVKICHNLILQITETRILLYQGIFEQIKILENQKHFKPKIKDLWNYPDIIMYAKIIDDHNLMIITQEHKLFHLKIESFELFQIFIKEDLTNIPIISCFESKKIMLESSSYVILNMIGDSQGQIFTSLYLIHDSLKMFNSGFFKLDDFESQSEKTNLDTGMVTFVEFDNISQDNVYITTSNGYLYILNLKNLVQDLSQGQIPKNLSKYKRIIIDLKSFLSFQEVLNWKIIGIQRKYNSNNHQIWKNRVILGSASTYIYVELLETNQKILKILQVKKLKLPICSIITQFNEIYFFTIQGTEKQQVKIIQIQSNKYHSCDKALPLKSIHYQLENMIYLKEKSWLIVNVESWDPYSISNQSPKQITSKLFLLDLEANLYGSKTFSINENCTNSKDHFRFRIFPNNGKDSFFQVFNSNESQACSPNTTFQLVSVQDHDFQTTSFHNDPFIVSGSYSFQGIISGLVYRLPFNHARFFFFLVGKGLDAERTLDLVSTRVISCMDISKLETPTNYGHNCLLPTNSQSSGQIISFGKLILKVEDFSIDFPGKKINHATVFSQNERIIMLHLLQANSYSSHEIVFHHTSSESKTNFKSFLQTRNQDDPNNSPQTSCIYFDNQLTIKGQEIQIYKGLSDQVSLLTIRNPLGQDSKLFIIGLQIILNYIYKRRNNEIISVFPTIITNLLFGIFDIVFSNKAKSNTSKAASSCSGIFFPKKKVYKIDRELIEDGLKNTNICLHQISYLYLQLCSYCVKWKIFMVLIVWYNIIKIIIDNQDLDLISIRKLSCPIFKDWNLEFEKDINIQLEMLHDHSYLVESFFNSDYYFQKYQELVFSEFQV